MVEQQVCHLQNSREKEKEEDLEPCSFDLLLLFGTGRDPLALLLLLLLHSIGLSNAPGDFLTATLIQTLNFFIICNKLAKI